MQLYVGILRAQVSVYDLGATGSAPPARTLVGPDTGLDGVGGVALDNAGFLYVGNESPSTVTVYPPGADGDTAPARIIAGDQTRLGIPASTALDSTGQLYVLNSGGVPANRTVTVYAPGATGNAAPVATIGGIEVDQGNLNAIAVDLLDQLYVSEDLPGVISVYPPGAAGSAVPVRRINGPSTRLGTVSGMDFDADNNLYVANGDDVLVFGPAANGDTAPTRVISGVHTGISEGFNLAVQPDGTIYVGDFDAGLTNGRITVYAPGAHGDAAPIRTITGLAGIPFGGMAIDKIRQRPRPSHFNRIPELVGILLGGVAVDGGGVVIVGGIPIPIGPWGPPTADSASRADLLIGMAIEQLGSHVADEQRASAIRASALELMKSKINQMIARLP
jgi:hypothetical protein